MEEQYKKHSKYRKITDERDNSSLWDRFWRDREGDVVIAQKPNKWLIAWLIFELISLFSASHVIENVSWWLATVVLFIWALLELVRGANYFRRLLGLIIVIMTVLTVFGIGL